MTWTSIHILDCKAVNVKEFTGHDPISLWRDSKREDDTLKCSWLLPQQVPTPEEKEVIGKCLPILHTYWLLQLNRAISSSTCLRNTWRHAPSWPPSLTSRRISVFLLKYFLLITLWGGPLSIWVLNKINFCCILFASFSPFCTVASSIHSHSVSPFCICPWLNVTHFFPTFKWLVHTYLFRF